MVTNDFPLYEFPGLGLHDFMDKISLIFKEWASPILYELIHEVARKGEQVTGRREDGDVGGRWAHRASC